MTIHVEWADDARTILVLKYEPGWNWEDVQSSVQRGNELGKDIDHPYYVINDVQAAPQLPNGRAITQLRAATLSNSPMIRYVYITGTNMLATSLVSMMQKLIPALARLWKVVPKIEDAYSLIEADKKTLAAASQLPNKQADTL
jgi:hypothetical protein